MGQKPDISGHRLETLIAALLVAVTLAVFARACSYGFVNYDDGDYVYQNRDVLQGLSVRAALWALTTTEMVNWHPVTWLSHTIDCQLYGLSPVGHHLTNSIIHTLNAILLFFMLRGLTGATWRSGFIAGLFL